MKILSDTNEPDAYDNDDEYEAQIYLCYEHRQKLQKQMNSMYRNHLDTLKVSALIVSPNARAKGRGRGRGKTPKRNPASPCVPGWAAD